MDWINSTNAATQSTLLVSGSSKEQHAQRNVAGWYTNKPKSFFVLTTFQYFSALMKNLNVNKKYEK